MTTRIKWHRMPMLHKVIGVSATIILALVACKLLDMLFVWIGFGWFLALLIALAGAGLVAFLVWQGFIACIRKYYDASGHYISGDTADDDAYDELDRAERRTTRRPEQSRNTTIEAKWEAVAAADAVLKDGIPLKKWVGSASTSYTAFKARSGMWMMRTPNGVYDKLPGNADGSNWVLPRLDGGTIVLKYDSSSKSYDYDEHEPAPVNPPVGNPGAPVTPPVAPAVDPAHPVFRNVNDFRGAYTEVTLDGTNWRQLTPADVVPDAATAFDAVHGTPARDIVMFEQPSGSGHWFWMTIAGQGEFTL